MTWNYRVMRHTTDDGDETWDAIHEVYYDENRKVTYWTEHPATIISEPDQINDMLDMVMMAVAKPILCFETGKLI